MAGLRVRLLGAVDVLGRERAAALPLVARLASRLAAAGPARWLPPRAGRIGGRRLRGVARVEFQSGTQLPDLGAELGDLLLVQRVADRERPLQLAASRALRRRPHILMDRPDPRKAVPANDLQDRPRLRTG